MLSFKTFINEAARHNAKVPPGITTQKVKGKQVTDHSTHHHTIDMKHLPAEHHEAVKEHLKDVKDARRAEKKPNAPGREMAAHLHKTYKGKKGHWPSLMAHRDHLLDHDDHFKKLVHDHFAIEDEKIAANRKAGHSHHKLVQRLNLHKNTGKYTRHHFKVV